MSRQKSAFRVPTHSLHKPTGQGYIRLNGQCFYTGKYGTPQAQAEYNRMLAEWIEAGNSRTHINWQTSRIRTMFSRGVESELVPVESATRR